MKYKHNNSYKKEINKVGLNGQIWTGAVRSRNISNQSG